MRRITINCITLSFLPMVISYCDHEIGIKTETLEYDDNPRDIYDDYNIHHARMKDVQTPINITVTCNSVIFPLSDTFESVSNCKECPVYLNIANSTISTVPASALEKISGLNLTILKMNNLGIQQIVPGAFNFVTKLQEIYLSRNKLKQIIPGTFSTSVNLTILDLSYNEIEKLNEHFLSGIQNLKLLNLSSNMLTIFEASLSNSFKLIQNFDVSYNKIRFLDFNGFESMNVLNVSHNKIEKLENCFSKIKILNLSNNRLNSLKNENCSSNNSLTTDLDLSWNNISVVDADIFKSITSLRRLQLQFNNITSIKNDVFSYHTNMTYLDLSHNKIQGFQYGFFERMEYLAVLNISYNNLTNVENNLHSLYYLTELNIEHNQVSSLDMQQLSSQFRRLRVLNIDKNNISCKDLIKIFHYATHYTTYYEKFRIPFGDTRNTSNIHGIACSEMDSDVTDTNDLNSYLFKIISSKLNGSVNNINQQNAMYEYFNNDFKSSNFYKYLESLQKDDSIKISESQVAEYFDKEFQNSALYKLLENLKMSENSTAEMNKSIYNYFNRDFKNSSFVRYLESFRTNAPKEYSNTDIYNYFNAGFQNSSFYKYLESFKKFEFPRNLIGNSDYSTEKLVKMDGKDYTGLLSVMTMILLILLVAKMLEYYFKYNSKKIQNLNEQVELIQS